MTHRTALMVISHYRSSGGANVVIDNLCKGLAAFGYDTALGAFIFDKEPPLGTTKIKLNRFRNLAVNDSGLDFDIIHSHETLLNYYSLLTRIPFVYHFHGTATRIQRLNLWASMLLCRKRISQIIAVSHSGLAQMQGKIGPIPTRVIYNGVDTNLFSTNLPKLHKKGDPQLLFVGVLYHHKNVSQIIENIPQIRNVFPNVHFQIVGDGVTFRKLESRIKELELERNVELVGKLSKEELRYRYSSCDIYISASKLEAYNLPILEAMASGKGLVLSDIPAHMEVINASGSGVLFSLSDPDITGRIKQAYESRDVLGKKARLFAEGFGWSDVCKQVAKAYDDILESRQYDSTKG